MAGPLQNALNNFLMAQERGQQKQNKSKLGQMLTGGDYGNLAQSSPMMYMQGQQSLYQQQQQKVQQQQAAQQQQLDAIENQRKKKLSRIESTAISARKLKSMDQSRWIPFLERQKKAFSDAGLQTNDTDYALELAKQGDFVTLNQVLDKSIGLSNQIKAQSGIGSQSYAPVHYTDDQGNVRIGMPTFNKATGESGFREIDVPGQLLKETESGKSKIRIQEAQAKADIKTSKIAQNEMMKLIAKGNVQAAQKAIEAADGAREQLPNLKKLIEMNKTVLAGGIHGLKAVFTDFLGTTPRTIGEYRAGTRMLLLPIIKSLGANPTEGERKFIESTLPRFESGSQETNQAILEGLLEIANRQIETGRLTQENLKFLQSGQGLEILSTTEQQVPAAPVQIPGPVTGIDFSGYNISPSQKQFLESSLESGKYTQEQIEKMLKKLGYR